jgi:hypothetical protein
MSKYISGLVKALTTGSFSFSSKSSSSGEGGTTFKIISSDEAEKSWNDPESNGGDWDLAHWNIAPQFQNESAHSSSPKIFTIHNGVQILSAEPKQQPITCFKHVKTPSGRNTTGGSEDVKSNTGHAKNFVKRLKTLKHPSIVHYIDHKESDNGILVSTEPIIPLIQYLDIWKDLYNACIEEKVNPESTKRVSWSKQMLIDIIVVGIYQVAVWLEFLHKSAGLVHGWIASLEDSVVVDVYTGDWLISGLSFSMPFSKDDREDVKSMQHLQHLISDLYPRNWIPRNLPKKSGWNPSLDIWHFSKWLVALFEYIQQKPHDSFAPILSIASSMDPEQFSPNKPSVLSKWVHPNPQGPFSIKLIQNITILESLLIIQDARTKKAFLTNLEQDVSKAKTMLEQQASDKNRLNFISFYYAKKYAVPCIQAMIQGALKDISPLNYLSTILTLIQYMPSLSFVKHALLFVLDLLDGRAIVLPSTSAVQTSTLPSTTNPTYPLRLMTMQALPKFKSHITKKLMNDKIYPHIALGWKDPEPVIREWTMRILLELTERLSDRLIHNEMERQLSRLLLDPHPGIRTNALICLGRMLQYWKPETGAKVLPVALIRGMGDPFPPVRTAALNILRIAIPLISANDLATKIMPLMCPLIIDADVSISALSKAVLLQSMDSVESKRQKQASDKAEQYDEKDISQMRIAAGRLWFMDWALTSTTEIAKDTNLVTDFELSDKNEKSVSITKPKVNMSLSPKSTNVDGWDDEFDFDEPQLEETDSAHIAQEPLQFESAKRDEPDPDEGFFEPKSVAAPQIMGLDPWAE